MKKIIILIIIFSVSMTMAYEQRSIMVEMSDGIKLSTMIYEPDDMSGAPYPVVLARTPYDAEENAKQLNDLLIKITDREKYIVVVQNVRGMNGSEGVNTAFMEDGWSEKKDGFETIEWIAGQEWCNGKIGMFGPSALAITQYLAAGAVPPHFTSGFPLVGSWSLYHNMVYQGGEFRELDAGLWVALFTSAQMSDTLKEHYNYDHLWEKVNCATRVDKMQVPMFHIGGWYDLFAPGQLQAFYDMQYKGGEGAKGKQKVMIGPWTHGTLGNKNAGDIQFPENAVIDLEELAISWFNYTIKGMKGGTAATIQPINLYLMGPDDQEGHWNTWLRYNEWPFTNTDTLRFYPAKDGSLSLEIPQEAQETFTFNPLLPVPTVGGNMLFGFTTGAGPKDQKNNVWERDDVLTFISPAFDEPYDLFGNMKLHLVASSEAKDTDFTGKLVDIYPDGRRILISDGILMARHRNSFSSEDMLEPGYIYDLVVDLNYTAYTIAPGHKLGLAVSSSNYPKYKANPNTGDPVHSNSLLEMKIVDNTIHYGGSHPTTLILPVRRSTSSVASKTQMNISGKTAVTHNNQLSLKTDLNTGTADINIISLQGNVLHTERINTTMGQIELPFNYPSGVYFIKIWQGSKIDIYKVLHKN